MRSVFFYFACTLFSSMVFAEYRVFTLQITNTKTNTNRQFDSTLDPEQYKSFYTLKQDEKIQYIDTWMCKGNTSGVYQLCAKVKSRL